jgi:hypothetical protein
MHRSGPRGTDHTRTARFVGRRTGVVSSIRHIPASRWHLPCRAVPAGTILQPDAIAMPQLFLRKARTEVALSRATKDSAAAPLPPGEWFVDESHAEVRVFKDADGAEHVADVPVVDFLDGLATRQIVFVSWG